MNVSVMQENLARGLQTVSRAVSSRATLPVLANVLLKTENAGLKLTATNLEIGINCWVPGKVDEEGEITVPAKLLTDLVASLPNQRIDLVLSAKDRTLKLTCGSNRSSIKGIEADEFPVVAAIGETPATSVDARVLREALGEVVFAAATDESRPILTGVLTRLDGDTMTLAAADNYRIAVRTLTLDKPVSPEMTIVVPGRSYAELMRILPDAEAPIEITVTPNKSQVLFHVEGTDLVSRLIEGQFPNYEPVIPTCAQLARRDRPRGVPGRHATGEHLRPRQRQHREDRARRRQRRSRRAWRSPPTRPTSATTPTRSRPPSRARRRRSPSTRAT